MATVASTPRSREVAGTKTEGARPKPSPVPAEVRKRIDQGLEFFLCSFVEMSGIPKAKLVPATHVDDMAVEGAGFAGFAAGDIGQGPHSPDLMAIPDFRSLTSLPWRKNIAWVAGNAFVEGKASNYCPRTILQRVLAKAATQNLVFKTGVEPEFFLVRQEDDRFVPWDTADNAEKPCYDLRVLSHNLDMCTTIVKYMQEVGWDPYANDHEDANCQFEINWTYSDSLTTADRHVFFRYMVKQVAEQHGLLATFMPKPFHNLTGNGAHFHMSLWDAKSDRNLFLDESDSMGLSKMAYHFIGGIKAHARAMAAVTNPLVNSYKRLIVGAPRSGATWAPVYVTYGGSNRTQMIRIPGPGRIEVRTIDGATNPYLAAAVTLAAGLDGVAKKMDAGAPNHRNLYEVPPEQLRKEGIEFLPSSLGEALDALEKDPVVKGALGEEYADYYIRTKREESNTHHRMVSDWERDQYLVAF
jgi:glutamine synthetase